MAEQASILHADLDAFYASVEQRDDPRLRGRPVIVGGGVVLAASYEAKACGVKTAMGGRLAKALCPQAIVVPPRMSAYSAASKAVFEVFRDTTPLVEGISIDEAFLDVGGLRKVSGEPADIAVRLRAAVKDRVGLAITVGVARTKFLAKVASGVAKPDGLLVVPPETELEFLHQLPVERLWGVGTVTSAKLHERRIRTVGQVARLGEAYLVSILGQGAGRHLHALAHNRDPRPVVVGRRRRSMGAQRAIGRGPHALPDLEATLAGLVDRVSRRMRAADRVGRTITLRLRFDDYSRATRSRTLRQPSSHTTVLLDAAQGLLAASLPLIVERGVTLIGVAVGNLDGQGEQLMLPLERPDDGGLDSALDAVRERFGSSAVTRATLLHRGEGFTVPLLPDD
ncbi:DNA polymerase IV [Cryptosporangium phraense]|uniref:DNA polymerase IV n=1 Tax=Cryptosporangium phraense TaxID=2593070 RepID=A0A545AT24_9ACTN|nr:DNA polymerase IV [Cryptosporangium phraense]TQS44401.1 DNA polymerase IV [Cryptosporangium phraense]